MGRDCCDHARRCAGRRNAAAHHRRSAGATAMRWILVGIIALCNTVGDVLNTAGMKRQGEAEMNPRAVAHIVARIFRNPLVLAGLGALAWASIVLLSLLSIPMDSFHLPDTVLT